MTAQLYCFGESGSAYKCALAMTLAGMDWQPVHVDFFNGAARTDRFRQLNVMAEVPVLVDGTLTLSQSGAILMHIAEKTGKLGATSPADQAEILRWILWDTHKLSGQAGPCRFLLNFLPEDKRPPGVAVYLQGRVKAAVRVLDSHLAGRDWVVGAAPSIADLACCSYLYYPEPFGFVRADWPHIDAWLDRLSALPGWQPPYTLMQRAYPPAAQGDHS
ncbi:MAG: glutathione S-transferase [Paracoccaceae bacterium]